jgi:outer membrane receptor protein involved in Fe transport
VATALGNALADGGAHGVVGFGTTLRNDDGESKRRGVELELKTKLVPCLYLGASYTFLIATDPDGLEDSDPRRLLAPIHGADV